MNFAWKFVLPLTLVNLFVTALWHILGQGWVRWLFCPAILIGIFVLMGQIGMRRGKIGPRRYRYAD